MRKTVLFMTVILFSFSAQAVFGTFASDKQQEGPEAKFEIGVVADQKIIVEINVEEVEGLNYVYEENSSFDIEEPDSQYMYGGEYMPVNYYTVAVSDEDPVQGVYEIPVTLRAYQDQDGRTGPIVVQEREYSFEYASGFEEEHGFGGDLITPEDPVEGNGAEEEETKTSEQLNETEREEEKKGEQETVEEDEGLSTSTYILAALLVLTVLYILREALT